MTAKTPTKARSKHQERTEATLAKLLVAAEAVFTRDGFANARLEQIAVEAGYTRGAIYAHYKSKEDLFLALFEQRVQAKIATFRAFFQVPLPMDERLRKFRLMLLASACDRSWSILILEFKLFALRQPKVKARLRRILTALHATSHDDFVQSLFGPMKAKDAAAIKRRFALLGSIASAAMLESHFRPELQGDGFEEVLGELFALVVRA